MSFHNPKPPLVRRLQGALLDFAGRGYGTQEFVQHLSSLVEEVKRERQLGLLDAQTSEVGAAVAAALKDMCSILLDAQQQTEDIKSDLTRDVDCDLQASSSSRPPSPPPIEEPPYDPSSGLPPPPSIFRHLRDWFLKNLEHPFPTSNQKKEMALTRGITVNQVNGWMTNMRRRSGWTQAERDFANSDHTRMRTLIKTFKAHPLTLARDVQLALERVEDYVDERGHERVRDWMVGVIEETSREVAEGLDVLGEDSEPDCEVDEDDKDDEEEYGSTAGGGRKRKVSNVVPTAPKTDRPARIRPPRRSASSSSKKPETASSFARHLKPLPKLRVSASSDVSRSVSIPSSPPAALSSSTITPPSVPHRPVSIMPSTQSHGHPSTAHRTSSLRNSSGSSYDSIPPTPAEEHDEHHTFNPHSAFYPHAHPPPPPPPPQTDYYAPTPAQEYPTQAYYGGQDYGHPPPPPPWYSHAHSTYGNPHPAGSRGPHPRQYSLPSTSTPTTVGGPSRRPSKRRAISHSHSQIQPSYAYLPPIAPQPYQGVYDYASIPLAPIVPQGSGSEKERREALERRRERIRREEEEIEREEREFGL